MVSRGFSLLSLAMVITVLTVDVESKPWSFPRSKVESQNIHPQNEGRNGESGNIMDAADWNEIAGNDRDIFRILNGYDQEDDWSILTRDEEPLPSLDGSEMADFSHYFKRNRKEPLAKVEDVNQFGPGLEDLSLLLGRGSIEKTKMDKKDVESLLHQANPALTVQKLPRLPQISFRKEEPLGSSIDDDPIEPKFPKGMKEEEVMIWQPLIPRQPLNPL